MKTVSKITDDQLTKLQEFRNFFTNVKMALGEATLAYESTKKRMLEQADQKDQEFEALRKELEEQYGKVNISIETGEYELLPETESVKPKLEKVE